MSLWIWKLAGSEQKKTLWDSAELLLEHKNSGACSVNWVIENWVHENR